MGHETIIYLNQKQFGDREQVVASCGTLSATTFRYRSGVCGLRLMNAHGATVLLPFQGQQIWSATFGGRDLTMRSMFTEPRPVPEFLHTFGGFMQHCGLSGIGGPGPEDTHALHGELPNASYQEAYLISGEDQRGPYLALGGRYRHTVAFALNYIAQPLVRLYEDEKRLQITMTVTNDKRSPMEFLYLAHTNFRPVNGGRLVYSAPSTRDQVRVRTTIPRHISPAPGYTEFIDQLAQDPSAHETFTADLAFDPEVVFFIDYLADGAGWAHTLQIHPDGSADYLRHRPAELPRATRWISRTPDQDAVALAEVGTGEPEGYTAEKRKGNVRVLGPGEKFSATFEAGYLDPDAAARLEAHVQEIVD